MASRCTWWSDPSDDFYGMCVKEAGHDREGDPDHENNRGIRWMGDRWEGVGYGRGVAAGRPSSGSPAGL